MKKIISSRTILLFSFSLVVVSVGIIVVHYTFFRSAFAQMRQPSFFSDYASWTVLEPGNIYYPSKHFLDKNNSLYKILTALNTSRTTWVATVEAGSQFVDLNGDGLLDFLYAQYYRDVGYEYSDLESSPREMRFAAFINKGNFSFEPIYKCYGQKGENNQIGFYGDCVQPKPVN